MASPDHTIAPCGAQETRQAPYRPGGAVKHPRQRAAKCPRRDKAPAPTPTTPRRPRRGAKCPRWAGNLLQTVRQNAFVGERICVFL